jgi:hypothetical protein
MALKDAVLMKGWYLLRKEKMRLCGLQKRHSFQRFLLMSVLSLSWQMIFFE